MTLVSSEVRDHYLRLDLGYGGGCEPHEFAVWWSGLVGPSAPPVVSLTLQHYDHGDACDAWVQHPIWVDLSPLHEIMLGTDLLRVGFDNHPGTFDYTFAEPAPPPSEDVLAIDQSCSPFVP